MKNNKNFFSDFVEEYSKLIFDSDEKEKLKKIINSIYSTGDIIYHIDDSKEIEIESLLRDANAFYIYEKKALVIYEIRLKNNETKILYSNEVEFILDSNLLKKYFEEKRYNKIINKEFYANVEEDKIYEIAYFKIIFNSKKYIKGKEVLKEKFQRSLKADYINVIFVIEKDKEKFEVKYIEPEDKYIYSKLMSFDKSQLDKNLNKIRELRSRNEELINVVKMLIPIVRVKDDKELSNEVYLRFLYGAIMNNYDNKYLTIQKFITAYPLKKIEEIKEELINIYKNFIGERFYKFYRKYFNAKNLKEEEIIIIHSKLVAYLMNNSCFVFGEKITLELIRSYSVSYTDKEVYSEISDNVKEKLREIVLNFVCENKRITLKDLNEILEKKIILDKCNESEKNLISELFLEEEKKSYQKIGFFYESITTLPDDDDDDDDNPKFLYETQKNKIINEYKNLTFYNFQNINLKRILNLYFEDKLDDDMNPIIKENNNK